VSDIVLSTLNARYSHASFGLRYLLANLGSLRPRAELLEFDIKKPPAECASIILGRSPRIVGLGVYIWNLRPISEVVALLRATRPDVVVVLGGPEVSFRNDLPDACRHADYTIGGEADLVFPDLCVRVLSGHPPERGFIDSPPADLGRVALPYGDYAAEDIAHRTIYVEASRGCAFDCEFCLSSLDVPVRRFDTDRILPEFERLLDRGVRAFKFVDRTFNIDPVFSRRIMAFFLERHVPGLFLHFEMIPDRLPGELKDLLAAFPPGSLQLEVGVQTFSEEVARRIRRRQDYAKTEENLRWLLTSTGAHLHADLIAGLPGETPESFAAGFDRLAAIGPQEIQVNILKKLRGTPIGRHDGAWDMVYSPEPPYELRRNRLMDEETVRRMALFGKCWDLVINSGRFQETGPMLWAGGGSVFTRFMEFSEWLLARFGRTHGIALDDLAKAVLDRLAENRPKAFRDAAAALARDYARAAHRRLPPFLAASAAMAPTRILSAGCRRALKRQALWHT
jgi:radical SAM superfamily enzyme YgiQ (UPF0313 family)